jgi:hypothetical protein
VSDCAWHDTAGVDFINNFEGTYASWAALPSAGATWDCPCKGLSRIKCIASIHG